MIKKIRKSSSRLYPAMYVPHVTVLVPTVKNAAAPAGFTVRHAITVSRSVWYVTVRDIIHVTDAGEAVSGRVLYVIRPVSDPTGIHVTPAEVTVLWVHVLTAAEAVVKDVKNAVVPAVIYVFIVTVIPNRSLLHAVPVTEIPAFVRTVRERVKRAAKRLPFQRSYVRIKVSFPCLRQYVPNVTVQVSSAPETRISDTTAETVRDMPVAAERAIRFVPTAGVTAVSECVTLALDQEYLTEKHAECATEKALSTANSAVIPESLRVYL